MAYHVTVDLRAEEAICIGADKPHVQPYIGVHAEPLARLQPALGCRYVHLEQSVEFIIGKFITLLSRKK